MKPTRQLQDLDQSLWLDNITRDLLSSRRLKQRIDELSVTNRTTAIRVPDRRNSL
jgi:transaldolase